MPAPLWLALINEAASGTGPTSVLDSIASPVNLAITYGAGGAAYTTISGGRAIATETGFTASASTASTKISSTLGGTKTATVLFVVAYRSGYNSSNFGSYFGIGDNTADILQIEAVSNRIEGWLGMNGDTNPALVYSFPGGTPALGAYVLRINSAAASSADRITLDRWDGSSWTRLADGSSGTAITLNATFSFGTGQTLNLGGYWGDPTTFNLQKVDLGLAALWSTALSDSDAQTYATNAYNNNDADPTGGAAIVSDVVALDVPVRNPIIRARQPEPVMPPPVFVAQALSALTWDPIPPRPPIRVRRPPADPSLVFASFQLAALTWDPLVTRRAIPQKSPTVQSVLPPYAMVAPTFAAWAAPDRKPPPRPPERPAIVLPPSALATVLTSLGWLQPLDPRALPRAQFRPQPSQPIGSFSALVLPALGPYWFAEQRRPPNPVPPRAFVQIEVFPAFTGTPIYTDASYEFYVWVPPTVSDLSARSNLVVAEPDELVVPPEERLFTA